MKNFKITGNPYLLFLPFLFFYIAYIFLIYNHSMWGDELRHYQEAQNLLHGAYSPPAPNVEIRNGPGYPMVIALFILLHVPLMLMKLFNAIFIYLSVVFLFKSLIRFVSFRNALIISIFWGCYYNSLDFIALLYSEAFSVFLVSALAYLLVKVFYSDEKNTRRGPVILAGLTFGLLILTKIIFGYVLLIMLLGCGVLWLLKRQESNYRKSVLVLLISFATVVPYLSYTYHLTGRLFYWGTSAGNNLYWMGTLAEAEYGNWFPDPQTEKIDSLSVNKKKEGDQKGTFLNLKNRNNSIPGIDDSIWSNHHKDFEEINKYSGVERDDAYKRVVMSNIKSHPVKFIQNCFSNVGRILFNFPYSYSIQKPGTLIRLPLNGIIAVLMIFCLYPTVRNWRKIDYPVRFLLFIATFYLGGTVLGSAEIRMFTVIVPILLLWIAFILQKTIKVNFKFNP